MTSSKVSSLKLSGNLAGQLEARALDVQFFKLFIPTSHEPACDASGVVYETLEVIGLYTWSYAFHGRGCKVVLRPLKISSGFWQQPRISKHTGQTMRSREIETRLT